MERSKRDVAPTKALEFFGNTVQQCEEGLSPKVTFTKKNYGKHDDSDDSDN
jgi:hypothetical protein